MYIYLLASTLLFNILYYTVHSKPSSCQSSLTIDISPWLWGCWLAACPKTRSGGKWPHRSTLLAHPVETRDVKKGWGDKGNYDVKWRGRSRTEFWGCKGKTEDEIQGPRKGNGFRNKKRKWERVKERETEINKGRTYYSHSNCCRQTLNTIAHTSLFIFSHEEETQGRL